jgi:hypothetical protein
MTADDHLVGKRPTEAAMNQVSKMKSLRCKLADKDPSITNLGKFDPDNFNAHEDAFFF